MCLSINYVSRLIMLSVTNEIILGRDNKKHHHQGVLADRAAMTADDDRAFLTFSPVLPRLSSFWWQSWWNICPDTFNFYFFTFCVSVTKAIINAKLPTLTSIGHAQLCRSKSKYFLWRQIVSQSPYLFLAFWQSFLLLSKICVCIIWLSKL